MIESQIFRQSGVGSRAWYIHRIKLGFPAGKTGFTYLRADSGEDGKQLSFDEIKSSMSQLVAAGYVKKHGKPDAPRSDKYVVTSFGHRYLEQHKDDLEDVKPEPVYEKREDRYFRDGKMISRIMVPKHIVDKLDGNVDGPVRVIKPATSPLPEQGSDTANGRETAAAEKTSPLERPIDRVAKAGITLGQEIEKHKAAVSKSPDSDTPEPASITPDTSAPEHHDSKSDEPTPPKNGNSDNLVDQIYEAMGRLLLAKFKKKAGITEYANIDVHQLIEFLESES